MTQPTIVQTKAPTHSGGTSATIQLASSVTATNSIYAYAVAAVSGSTPPITTVEAVQLDGDAGSPTGTTYTMTAIAVSTWLYETDKSIGYYRADNVAAGFYNIVVTLAGSGICSLGGYEISNAGANVATYVSGTSSTESVAASISVGPVPSSGTLTSTDGLAFFAHSSANGNGSMTYTTPSTWTASGNIASGSGQMAMSAYTKALSANTALTAVGTPSASSLYGMAGVMVILDSVVGAGLTKYVKITNEDNTPLSLATIVADVHLPATTGKKGLRIFTASSNSWATTESSKSVMKIPVPASSAWEVTGITLDVDDTVIVTGGAADGSHGFVDQAVGIIIEE